MFYFFGAGAGGAVLEVGIDEAGNPAAGVAGVAPACCLSWYFIRMGPKSWWVWPY